MKPFDIANLVMGGIGSIGGIGVGIANAVNQQNAHKDQVALSEKNLNFQKEQYSYQKNLQKQVFAREDNSMVRRVNDLKNAGLSPVLATGSGAGAGGVVSTTAPQQNMDHVTSAEKKANAMSNALQSAMIGNQLLQQKADISKTQAQTELTKLQQTKLLKDTDTVDISNAYQREANPLALQQIKSQINIQGLDTTLKGLDIQMKKLGIKASEIANIRSDIQKKIDLSNLPYEKQEKMYDAMAKSLAYKTAQKNYEFMQSTGLPAGFSLGAFSKDIIGGVQYLKTQANKPGPFQNAVDVLKLSYKNSMFKKLSDDYYKKNKEKK